MKRLFCALLLLLTSAAWAGTMGLDIGKGGSLTFKERKNPVWGSGNFLDFGTGKNLFAAVGHYNLSTGHFLSSTGTEWLYGAGGHISFSGCLDINGDGDSAKHCDKKDFSGKLFTGTFTNAKIMQVGKNTFTLNGQLWLTPAAGLVKTLGVSAVPFLANISLRFTDTCTPSGPSNCKANIISGKVFATAPEPTSFVLLGLGMFLAGLGHTTVLAFFRPHA